MVRAVNEGMEEREVAHPLIDGIEALILIEWYLLANRINRQLGRVNISGVLVFLSASAFIL